MKRIPLFLVLFVSFFYSNAQEASIDSSKTSSSSTSPQKGGLAISPATMYFSAPKGQLGKQVIKIANTLDTTYTFQIHANDWDIDSVGNSIQYRDSGSITNSCASWLTFSPNIVTVGPGETANILATLRVPDNEKAGKESHWCAISVMLEMEKVAPQKVSPGLSVGFTPLFNVVLHVFETAPTATDKDVRMVDFNLLTNFKTSDTSKPISVLKIAGLNTGSVVLKPLFNIKLSSMMTGKTVSFDRPNCVIFPGHRRVVYFDIPADLPKGKYLAIASIDGGEDVPLEVSQKEIDIE